MVLSSNPDEHFMREALKLARRAYEEGEIPVGAIVVCDRKIISKGFNQTEKLNDSTAHAEILALTGAFQELGAKYIPDCTLYVTLEPCLMCAGATYWAQLGRLVYGAKDIKRGYGLIKGSVLHPKTQVTYGILEDESRDLLNSFFNNLRDNP